jgi:hypothetical protein
MFNCGSRIVDATSFSKTLLRPSSISYVVHSPRCTWLGGFRPIVDRWPDVAPLGHHLVVQRSLTQRNDSTVVKNILQLVRGKA